MRNHDEIIKKAAETEGMSYPLDDETMAFSRSIMRSMDSAVDFINGNYEPMDVKGWIDDYVIKTEAVIKYAAMKAGIPYPVETPSCDWSESMNAAYDEGWAIMDEKGTLEI